VRSPRRSLEASETDVLGPVDYLVVEFPTDKANFSGEMATELRALVDREVVRVLDLVIVRKEPDGSVEVAELADVDERNVGELRTLEADLAMLLAEEDVDEIAKALEPGSIAAVLVYENSDLPHRGTLGPRPRRHRRAARRPLRPLVRAAPARRDAGDGERPGRGDATTRAGRAHRVVMRTTGCQAAPLRCRRRDATPPTRGL
jgi:hypothetical protein